MGIAKIDKVPEMRFVFLRRLKQNVFMILLNTKY